MVGMAALALGALVAGKPAEPVRQPVRELVEAERAFARRVAADGVRAGFLAYLAEDAVVFRPKPVPARAWYEGRPDPPVRLEWEPGWAEASAGGDLGYTTGPWTARPREGGKPPAHGLYVTVWRRTAAGEWRAAVDCGVDLPAALKPPREATLRSAGLPVKSGPARFDVLAADRALASAAATQGWAAAFAGRAAPDVWILRDGREPAVGLGDAAAVAGADGVLTWQPESGEVAGSGDLGYAYGTYRRGDETGSYLRVWRWEQDGWRVALDLLQPAPPG